MFLWHFYVLIEIHSGKYVSWEGGVESPNTLLCLAFWLSPQNNWENLCRPTRDLRIPCENHWSKNILISESSFCSGIMLSTTESGYLQFVGEGPVWWEVSPRVGRRNRFLFLGCFATVWHLCFLCYLWLNFFSFAFSSSSFFFLSPPPLLFLFSCFFYCNSLPKPQCLDDFCLVHSAHWNFGITVSYLIAEFS